MQELLLITHIFANSEVAVNSSLTVGSLVKSINGINTKCIS